jgi:pre-rRNA-processing protein IPI1
LKRKVGRKAPHKTNDTQTSFKFRRVNVGAQSILEEKGTAVTVRKLNLSDLLTKLRHYSGSVRKQAYLGLRELHDSHPKEILAHLQEVLTALFEGLSDTEKTPRSAMVTNPLHKHLWLTYPF